MIREASSSTERSSDGAASYDVEGAIQEAARRVLPGLSEEQLRRRLARREGAMMRRPPRAWCVAVRAADGRINPWNAAIVPEDAVDCRDLDHPGRYLPHTVVMDKRLIEKLCRPVWVEHGTSLRELGRMVGSTPGALKIRRLRGVFRTEFKPCARGTHWGNWTPVFAADGPLDPGAHLLAAPDSAWSWTARSLAGRVPDGFEQTVTRVPLYRPRTTHFEKERLHPEAPGNDVALRAGRSVRLKVGRLPGPPPDPVWYKWKGDVYVGYDWRNPHAKAGYERRQRRLELGRAANRRFRARHRERLLKSGGSLWFRGWKWVCPGCKKTAKVLLLPVRPVNLIETHLLRRIVKRARKSVGCGGIGFARPEDWYARTFACGRCHRVSRFTRTSGSAWNQLISYLTGGLLYGREVARPAEFEARKRPFRPRLRAAPRREQVLRRVLNGWTTRQICRDLGMARDALGHHIRALCRQESVKNRHELARKLKSGYVQPLSQKERAAERRAKVLPLLVRGDSYRQIMEALSLDLSTVLRDVTTIYRQHGVGGRGRPCRRLLAEKLGRAGAPAGGNLAE